MSITGTITASHVRPGAVPPSKAMLVGKAIKASIDPAAVAALSLPNGQARSCYAFPLAVGC
jgi:hypothetical protein